MESDKVGEYDCENEDEYIEDNQISENQSNIVHTAVREKVELLVNNDCREG